jgi:hypothetical protein
LGAREERRRIVSAQPQRRQRSRHVDKSLQIMHLRMRMLLLGNFGDIIWRKVKLSKIVGGSFKRTFFANNDISNKLLRCHLA